MPAGQQRTEPRYEWAFIFIVYANHDQGQRMVDDPRNPGGSITETALWVSQLKNDLLQLKIDTKYKILLLENEIIRGIDTTYLQHLSNGELIDLTEPIHEPLGLQRAPQLGARLQQLKAGLDAERLCPVFCDHGSIFGINKVMLNSSFPGLSIPFEVLTNDELAEAVRIGFGSVDLLIMYNCNMANLATLFSLKGITKILLGACATVFFPGYNFKYVLNQIAAQTDPMDADKVADLFLASFTANNDMYDENSADRTIRDCVKEIDTWIMGKFYPDDINERFISDFNQLCIVMTRHIRPAGSAIRSVISRLCALDRHARDFKHTLFDFQSFLINLHRSLTDNPVASGNNELLGALSVFTDKRNLPRNALFIGRSAFASGPDGSFQRELQHPSGLGLFFPRQRRDVEAKIDFFFERGNNPLATFFQATEWLTFCRAYATLFART